MTTEELEAEIAKLRVQLATSQAETRKWIKDYERAINEGNQLRCSLDRERAQAQDAEAKLRKENSELTLKLDRITSIHPALAGAVESRILQDKVQAMHSQGASLSGGPRPVGRRGEVGSFPFW